MSAPAPIPRFILAIDWETSGFSTPNYAGQHQGISFGAIICDLKTFSTVEELYCEIKFDPKYEWSARAEQIHGLSREYLQQHGMSQEQAATLLANLVVKYMDTEPVMILGHRVHFDRAFTDQLTEVIGINFEFHPTFIDSCSMAVALMEMSKSEEVFTTLGLPARGKHNALEDIRMTVQAIKRMKDFFIAGVTSEINLV